MRAMSEWAMVQIDEKVARQFGVPAQVPVPKDEFESMEHGLDARRVQQWITQFVQQSAGAWRTENAALAARFDSFLGKMPQWEKAQKAFEKGDYAGAAKALDMVRRLDKEDHAAQLNLATAQAALGDTEKALETMGKVSETFAGEPDFHTTRAKLMAALGQRDEAIGELVDALEAKPDHKPAMDELVRLGVLVKVYEDPKDPESLTYVRADSLEDYFEQQWDAEERSLDYYLEQIAYHELEQRPELVLAAAERARKLSGSGERVELARIASLRQLSRIDEATDAARSYAAEQTDSAGPLVELGACAAAQGNAEEAKQHFDAALERDPGDQQALHHRFWPSADELDAYAKAEPALREFVDAHRDSAGAVRALARMTLRMGNDDEALALYQEAVGKQPDDDDLRSEYWSELGRQQKWDQLVADAEKLGDMGQRSWQLRWNEAEAYRATKQMDKARAAYMAINADETLVVEIRKRAKRAVDELAAPKA